MKKRLLTAVLALTFLTFAAPVRAEEVQVEGSGLQHDLVILFTSDVHCGVDENFTLAGLSEIRKAYEQEGDYTLLVDDGDFIQGEPIGTLTKGSALIDLMNAEGYDIAIPGNHEYDYGMDRFLELAGKAEFPYISANFNKEGELLFPAYVIREFDGVKFGFVGVTTPKTLTSSNPKNFRDADGNFIYGFFEDTTGKLLYGKVQEAVDAARSEGAEYVILVAHLGNEDICSPWRYDQVVANTEGIDVVLDGHSHDTDQVVMKNKNGEDVIRSAVGTKMQCIGTMRFAADGTITNNLLTWDFDMPADTMFGIRNGMTEAMDKATGDLDAIMSEVLAETAFDLTINDPEAVDSEGVPVRIVRRAETNLGDLVADAFRDATGADIALVNGGAIRASIPAGKITKGDILTVQPFNNKVSVIEATGQQVLDALEWGARAVPEENGGFLQVSGLTYEIYPDIESSCTEDEDGMFTGITGEYRVKNVLVGGEPLDPGRTYSICSDDYLVRENGDGFTMFDGAKVLGDGVILSNQAVLNYITDTLGGEIGEEYENPYGQGRITAAEGQGPDEVLTVSGESTASSVPSEAESVPTETGWLEGPVVGVKDGWIAVRDPDGNIITINCTDMDMTGVVPGGTIWIEYEKTGDSYRGTSYEYTSPVIEPEQEYYEEDPQDENFFVEENEYYEDVPAEGGGYYEEDAGEDTGEDVYYEEFTGEDVYYEEGAPAEDDGFYEEFEENEEFFEVLE